MEQQQEGSDFKRNFNIAFGLLFMHNRALVIPMRNRWGCEALGIPCALAVLLMFVWAFLSRDGGMWLWMGMWLLCFIQRRIESLWRTARGEVIHSQYDGMPDTIWIGRTQAACKLIVEPMFIGILGGVAYWLYQKMGWEIRGLPWFLLTGCFSLPFVELVKQKIWRRRIQGMADARIEQEAAMRDYCQRYGDS